VDLRELRLGYVTNGLADVDAAQAIDLLHEVGYRAVGFTLDKNLLNPYAEDLQHEIERTRDRLERYEMRCVIETGARHLLNPDVKHEPTLVSPESVGRARRVDFLRRAIDISAAIHAECVSIWSGRVHDGAEDGEVMRRLVNGLAQALDHAATKEVHLAFEPEPDMFIDTMAGYANLLDELTAARVDTSHLRLTIDIGHLHCQGEVPIADYLREWKHHLANVHIEDMCSGVHEHLMFGEGEIDFPPVIAALQEIDYSGPVNVELSRHAHVGPEAARQAYDFLASISQSAANQ
jgi:L-ribulose-5-phosphate 3-epimerase